MMRTLHAALLSAALFAWPCVAATRQSGQEQPSIAPVTLPDGPLQITVSAVQGKAQARQSEQDPWVAVEVGQTYAEGAEFRTSARSAVQLTVGNDQVVTLDRLGKARILRATLESGKVYTDIGMPYGRTRHAIDASAMEHESRVLTPNSVLAVTGTDYEATDQVPFPPMATSYTGRVVFRDARKLTTVGAKGGTLARLSSQDSTPADTARAASRIDPRGAFSGRSETDRTLQLSMASYGGNNFSSLGVLSAFEQARNGQFTGAILGSLPVGNQLSISSFFQSSNFSNVDLTVFSPRNEVLAKLGDRSPSGGNYILDLPWQREAGAGFDQVLWEFQYPPGRYSIRATLKEGQEANVRLQVQEIGGDNRGTTIDRTLPAPGGQRFFEVRLDPRELPSLTPPQARRPRGK
jgi:hypothetical protein